MTKPKVIFFGNGPLATAVFGGLKDKIELIFWAKKKEDLGEVEKIVGSSEQKIYAVLASYGVIIPERVLNLFEPEGIINIHPSYLPDLRGPSPIETAILRGDIEFGVSVMKLALKMDAGPIYYQTKYEFNKFVQKAEIYDTLGKIGGEWVGENLLNLPEPILQDEAEATYSKMLDTSMAKLKPEEQTAEEMFDQVRAFAGFPKTRYEFFGKDCIVLSAHVANEVDKLSIRGKDGLYLVVDEVQPAGRKPMNSKSFINGYGCKEKA
ncbi:methionyl-tRNA formyltransferase [Candidatus Saccharibacteria bacterium]|nr:methionyl-tRNA formyltransferase [Candidatus Saccharibacteria bacterium]